MKLGIYLKLLRIHTACLTMAGTMLGAIVGGERSPITLLIFAVWALCFHAWGFLQNNLYDLKYDMNDPSKQHFPLVDGTIKVTRAWGIHYFFLWVVLSIGFIMSFLTRNAIPILFLLTAITFGTMYNMFSKRTLLAPLFITISFASLPLFSFLMVSDTLNTAILLVTAYTIFLMMYQISVEGYLKDIGSDKINLLRTLGTTLNPPQTKKILSVSGLTKLYAWALTIPKLLILMFTIYLTNGRTDAGLLVVTSILVIIYLGLLLLESGPFDNAERVRLMSLIEISSYLALVFALQGILGWILMLIFTLFPILWFVLLNRLTWGTLVRPRV